MKLVLQKIKNLQWSNSKLRNICVASYFILWLILGASITNQYGISIDEPVERRTGIVSLNYIGDFFQIQSIQSDYVLSQFKDIKLNQYQERVYGPLFAQLSVFLERLLNIGHGDNEREIYQFRHFLTFIFCMLGGYALYSVSSSRFNDWRIGLLTVTFFILSPRLFADSFYNTKDLIFLSFYAIALTTCIRFILNPNLITASLHALTCAMATDTRNIGITIFFITLVVFFIKLLQSKSWKIIIPYFVIYIVLFTLATIALWPWLWEEPWGRFQYAFKAFSGWTFRTNPPLIFGVSIPSSQLPWFYLPLWIVITTPVIFTCLFLVGSISTIYHLMRNRWSSLIDEKQLQDLIFLGISLAPIIMAVVLKTPLYDGWRHFYFISIGFLLIATKGLLILWNQSTKKYYHYCIVLIVICTLGNTALWMIKANPYQNIYFNFLAGKNIKTKFDVDYWGLSNRQALEYILSQDSSLAIRIFAGSAMSLESSVKILPPADKRRLIEVNWIGVADYVLTNYRDSQIDYGESNSPFYLIKEIKVGNEVIASIFKQKGGNNPVLKVLPHQAIFFGSSAAYSNTFLGFGWSNPEPWGVWSAREKVTIKIPLPFQSASQVILEGRALVTNQYPTQEVNVSVNGVLNQSTILNRANNNKIIIPLSDDDRKMQYMTIDLTFPKRIRPKDLGIGDDVRELAFGLEHVTFQ